MIAVESPAYFGVLQTIEGLGLRALEIPAHPRTGLDVDRVRGDDPRSSRCARSCVTPTISNPLGSIMPEDERERLVRIAQRADIPIIEDDVYGELVFDGSRPRPLRSFADRRGQPRRARQLGVARRSRPAIASAGSPAAAGTIRSSASSTASSLACPALLGMAVAEFLASGGYDRHLRRLRTALAGNVERYREAIARRVPRRHARVVAARRLRAVGRAARRASTRSRCTSRRCAAASWSRPDRCSRRASGSRNFIRISAGTPWSDRISASIRTLGRLVAKE